MPLVRIDLNTGKPAASRSEMGKLVHRAMVEVLGVPEDDRFQVITEHPAGELIVTPSYLGIAHGPDAGSIKEVSERLGYSDPAHFARAFRRWMGESPTAYARRTCSSNG